MALPHTWIILVIVKQYLVHIGRIDGPTEYLSQILTAIKLRFCAQDAFFTDKAQAPRPAPAAGTPPSGDTAPCKVTPVILHGGVSCTVTPVILHGVVSPEGSLPADTSHASTVPRNLKPLQPPTARGLSEVQGFLVHKKPPPPWDHHKAIGLL